MLVHNENVILCSITQPGQGRNDFDECCYRPWESTLVSKPKVFPRCVLQAGSTAGLPATKIRFLITPDYQAAINTDNIYLRYETNFVLKKI